MKFLNTKNIALFTIAATVVLISSCKKDFYEIKDPNGLEVEGAFEDAGAVGLFLNRTYALIMPVHPNTSTGSIHMSSDEMNGGSTAFLYGQLVENSVTDIATGTSITANRYADIRRCNLAIEGLNASTTISETDKAQLKGQFFFLRAMAYFKLVRLYGGVPLVLRAQTLEEESLQVPRAKTSVCIAAIANDLDSAAAMLPVSWTATSDINRVTKAAAMALKGRTLLLWASPQFNITNDAVRWTNAYTACKAAYDQCVADGYALFPNYANVLTDETVGNKEILISRKYNTNRDLGHNLESLVRPNSESNGGGGSFRPTWNLVRKYTTNDGRPITAPGVAGVIYNDTTFWLNRDPRFAASISYNGDTWALSGKPGRRQWNHTPVANEGSNEAGNTTGFYCKRLSVASLAFASVPYVSNSGGGNGTDWIEMRFAEVITNLAECAVETGNITEAKAMIRMLRQRAGIIQGSFDYGLSLAVTAADMRALILDERAVEFAFEGGMRYHDLRRTRNLNLITARMAYIPTVKLPYVGGVAPSTPVAGRIYIDHPYNSGVINTNLFGTGIKPRDTIQVNNKFIYATIYNHPVVPTSIEGANVISIPDRYYVYALPNLLSQSPGIEQTIGWSGGTFDPYQ